MDMNGSGKKLQKRNILSEMSQVYVLSEQSPAVSTIQRHETQHTEKMDGSNSHEMNPEGQPPSPAANMQHALNVPNKTGQ